jgi:hypothetical protein
MPYRIRARFKGSAFSVIVETARDALCKIAEFSELPDYLDVAAMDLSGAVVDVTDLQALAGSTT